MDETRSSGFQSKLMYMHGCFESSIKLPDNYSAGAWLSFYTCNDHRAQESWSPSTRVSATIPGTCIATTKIDFEFLGNIHDQEWLAQTNFYGNGSTSRGREETYVLWFDSLKDFHHHGILWTDDGITYHEDDVPIRRVRRVEAMRGDFPSKEWNFMGTIWNWSDWATSGEQHKLDLSYGTYVAKYSGFVLNGCAFNLTKTVSVQISEEFTNKETARLQGYRRKYMTYSYCHNKRQLRRSIAGMCGGFEEPEHLRKFDRWTFGAGI